MRVYASPIVSTQQTRYCSSKAQVRGLRRRSDPVSPGRRRTGSNPVSPTSVYASQRRVFRNGTGLVPSTCQTRERAALTGRNRRMTTTATLTPACPSWCTLADRELHRHPGLPVRDHAGPTFGPFISTGAGESVEAPSILHYFVFVQHDGGVSITAPAELPRPRAPGRGRHRLARRPAVGGRRHGGSGTASATHSSWVPTPSGPGSCRVTRLGGSRWSPRSPARSRWSSAQSRA